MNSTILQSNDDRLSKWTLYIFCQNSFEQIWVKRSFTRRWTRRNVIEIWPLKPILFLTNTVCGKVITDYKFEFKRRPYLQQQKLPLDVKIENENVVFGAFAKHLTRCTTRGVGAPILGGAASPEVVPAVGLRGGVDEGWCVVYKKC